MRGPAAAALLIAFSLHAAEPPREPTPEEGSVTDAGRFTAAEHPGNAPHLRTERQLRESLTVQRVGEDALVIGKVDLDVKERTVSFPARVILREGLMEYAVVHTSGKTHESLFATEVRPEAVHLGCLLLGATNPPATLVVEVTWDRDGQPARHRLEDLLLVEGKPMSPRAWRYVGSAFDANGFAASFEGSLIAIIRDPAALVENADPDAEDDEIHTAASDRMPADGTPVRIHLRLGGAPAGAR